MADHREDKEEHARLREAAASLAKLASEPDAYQLNAAALFTGRVSIGILRDPIAISAMAGAEELAQLPLFVRLMCGLEGENPVTGKHLTDIDMLLAGEPGDPVPSLNALRAGEAVDALTALRRIAIAHDSAAIARLADYALYFLLSRFGDEGDLVRMAVIRINTTTEAQGSGHLRPGGWTLPARARQIALARLRLVAAACAWAGTSLDIPVSTVATLIGGCFTEFLGLIETAHADLLADLKRYVAGLIDVRDRLAGRA